MEKFVTRKPAPYFKMRKLLPFFDYYSSEKVAN